MTKENRSGPAEDLLDRGKKQRNINVDNNYGTAGEFTAQKTIIFWLLL
jgi:hypothetical protein